MDSLNYPVLHNKNKIYSNNSLVQDPTKIGTLDSFDQLENISIHQNK